jgi:hypothetical protein
VRRSCRAVRARMRVYFETADAARDSRWVGQVVAQHQPDPALDDANNGTWHRLAARQNASPFLIVSSELGLPRHLSMRMTSFPACVPIACLKTHSMSSRD